jgi:hypothetical protein
MGGFVNGRWSMIERLFVHRSSFGGLGCGAAIAALTARRPLMENTGPDRQHEQQADHEEKIRRSLNEDGKTSGKETFNPRTGEDPGLLELTEDPLERRQKRHTM